MHLPSFFYHKNPYRCSTKRSVSLIIPHLNITRITISIYHSNQFSILSLLHIIERLSLYSNQLEKGTGRSMCASPSTDDDILGFLFKRSTALLYAPTNTALLIFLANFNIINVRDR